MLRIVIGFPSHFLPRGNRLFIYNAGKEPTREKRRAREEIRQHTRMADVYRAFLPISKERSATAATRGEIKRRRRRRGSILVEDLLSSPFLGFVFPLASSPSLYNRRIGISTHVHRRRRYTHTLREKRETERHAPAPSYVSARKSPDCFLIGLFCETGFRARRKEESSAAYPRGKERERFSFRFFLVAARARSENANL